MDESAADAVLVQTSEDEEDDDDMPMLHDESDDEGDRSMRLPFDNRNRSNDDDDDDDDDDDGSSSSGDNESSTEDDADYAIGCDAGKPVIPNKTQQRKQQQNRENLHHFFLTEPEVIEIILTVAPRDVHKQNRNGSSEWILNQKPKKNAEISFKKLTEDDQDLFTEAMEKKSIHIWITRQWQLPP